MLVVFLILRVARAKSGKGWATLSLLRDTAHGRARFHRAEHILNPGYPGRGGSVIQQSLIPGGCAPRSKPLDKEGGRRSPQKHFSAHQASVWSKNKGGGGGPPPPPGPPLDPPLLQGNVGFLDS